MRGIDSLASIVLIGLEVIVEFSWRYVFRMMDFGMYCVKLM